MKVKVERPKPKPKPTGKEGKAKQQNSDAEDEDAMAVDDNESDDGEQKQKQSHLIQGEEPDQKEKKPSTELDWCLAARLGMGGGTLTNAKSGCVSCWSCQSPTPTTRDGTE